MTSYRLIQVTCPLCMEYRNVPYRQWWGIQKGITSNKCFKCSRPKKNTTNKGSFKKGHRPWHTGTKGLVKVSLETRQKMSISRKGKKRGKITEKWRNNLRRSHMGLQSSMKGKKHSLESRKKMSLARIGRFKGENNPSWIKDRSKVQTVNRRWIPKYKEWRNRVFTRDGFMCRICNSELGTFIQAHHILRWADHPEHRYDVNNGITLCRAHHPLKRAEEKRLAPKFFELVSVSKDHYFQQPRYPTRDI